MAGRYFRRARRAAPDLHDRNYKGRRRALRCEPLEDRRLLAVLTVDTELDVVDSNDGLMSLREAVLAANAAEGLDEIRFDFGHDNPATMLLTGGEIAITEGLAIVGLGSEVFTIDAQQNSRIFNVSGEAVDVELSGMTLLNGRTTGDNLSFNEILQQTYSGGAIRSASPATLRIDGLAIRGSSVTGDNTSGGAIFASGSLIVANSAIRGNSASGRNGVGGGIAATLYAAITATTVAGNTASRGGGVSVTSTGTLYVDRSTFNGNVANDSFAALGGAIYSAGSTNVISSTISGNSAKSTGFDSLAQGAGIWVSGDATIRHSTIIANTASSLGAGAVGSGGGVYATASASAALSIDHTIVAGNFATEVAAEMLVDSRTLRVHYSLIADNDGTVLSEAPIGWADHFGNLIGGPTYGFIDPLLGPLANNGGPTRTHALLPGSPAIFAGDPWRAPGDDWSDGEASSTTPEFDQRGAGYSRRTGTRIDIGAVEYSGRTLIVDSLADDVDGDYGLGKFTLREALAVANENLAYDVIEFSPSILNSSPATIYLKNGALAITQEAAIYGPGADRLVISGSGNLANSRVMTASANMELRGLTITAAKAGGINSTKDLTLINVAVTDCTASTGAGINGMHLTMIASRVEGNKVVQGTGGIVLTGNLYMDRSAVLGNLYESDSTYSAGGISVRPGLSAQEVVIANSVISGNSGSFSGSTGGMTINTTTFVMYNTLVAENTGRSIGGLRVNSSETIILNSSVVRNVGVGLGLSTPVTSRLGNTLIEDSTISGNRAQLGGGGGGVSSNTGLTVRRSTITDNSLPGPYGQPGGGSGISISAGRLVLESSIVAGNHGPDLPDVEISGRGSIAATYSLIGDNRGSTLAEVGPDSSISTNRIGGPIGGVLSAGLGPLMDNGGPVMPEGYEMPTHLPLPGSLAIGHGKPADATTPEFDQRGEPYSRVVGGIDIGAVEAPVYSGSATGDFNQDGKVDGVDFLAWQRGFGNTDATVSDGDGLPNGQVDGNDLAIWKQQYGTVSSNMAAVAEAVNAVAARVVASEQVAAIVAEEVRHWSVPLTPAVEEFARRADAEELLAAKWAAFALQSDVRGAAFDSSGRGVERSAAGEGLVAVAEVDVAFEEAEGMERLAWGLTGR